MILFKKSQLLRGLTMLLLIKTYTVCTGQSQISGKVTEVYGAPLGYANILLLQARDSAFIKGEIAKDDGTYYFKGIADGDYLCKYSMVGYPDKYSKTFVISGTSAEIDLGTTTMDESITLEGVEIVAKRAFLEQKVDRMVVNVSNSITNAGGNALEVLTRSPGVRVNRLTKTITMTGKEGVIVMINGKISRVPADAVIQLLEGMQADNIDKIELIHTPPSSFDAEGNAGIINIVLKSTGDEGLNGNYFANAGYGFGGKHGVGFNFNYRKQKLNWYGGYDYNYNRTPQLFTNYRGVYQANDFLETDTKSNRDHTPTITQNAKLGMDYQLSSKTVVGILANFNERDWYMEALNETTLSKNKKVESAISMPNTEVNLMRTYTGNFNITHTFAPDNTLTLDADLIHVNIHNPSEYIINERKGQDPFLPKYSLNLRKETPIDVFVTKVDYVFKIKDIRIETGLKYTKLTFDNDISVDSIAPGKPQFNLKEYTSIAHLDENIKAGYASAAFKIGSKTDIKAGLRYEHTITNLGTVQQPNIVDRNYGSWFPSLFITHKITEKQSLNLSYSRRIFRPQMNQLAPFLVFTDPTTLLGGNPALQPSFTDAYKLDYNVSAWRLGISYSTEKYPIRWVPVVDAERNRQVNTTQNLENEIVIGGYIYVPFSPANWWNVTSSVFLNATSTELTLDNIKITLDNINYGFNLNNTFTLPHNYSLELSGNYNAPSYFGLAKFQATGALNIGVQKNLGEKWGKLSANISDLFLSTNWIGKTEQPQNNLLVDLSFRFAERTFMVSWTNTFGSKKLKSSRNRSTGASEEMQRI
jgi:hypothetical protein